MDFSKKDINYQDYLEEIKKVENAGSMEETLKKVPGGEKMDVEKAKKELKQVEKIILSMSDVERSNNDIEFSNERREELADKAHVEIEEVHKLIRNFARIKLLIKNMNRFKQQ